MFIDESDHVFLLFAVSGGKQMEPRSPIVLGTAMVVVMANALLTRVRMRISCFFNCSLCLLRPDAV